ncbi:MAG TPA: tetratricopeptide repeat protein [Burkholderiales bacterium]|nr:tetratricopeptide repeat protein [Burkholderiales bacterium]
MLGALIRRLVRDRRASRARHAPAPADFEAVREALDRGDGGAARAAFSRLPPAAQLSSRGNELAGLIEYDAGRFERASALLECALAADPNRATVHCNLGQCLQLLGELDAAALHLSRALELAPGFRDAQRNLALVYYRAGDLGAAEALCRRTVLAEPDRAATHILLGEILLAQGRYAEAWPEFEWRREDIRVKRARSLHPAAQWNGEALPAGETLLLWTEQGYGDMFQFARFLPAAAARLPGVRLVVACPESVQGLMRRVSGVGDAIAQAANPEGAHRQAALLSLPLRLGADAAAVRNAGTYLRAEPARIEHYARRLQDTPAPRVGLVWQSGRHTDIGHADALLNASRDIDFGALAGALPQGRLRYLNLQLEHGLAPRAFAATGVEDWSGSIRDFEDTAALLANLDLVVTVDTSVAHLAAALGRPTWVLCRFDACWRWMKGAAASDWYPAARRFFQHSPRDWSAALGALRAELEGFGVQARSGAIAHRS